MTIETKNNMVINLKESDFSDVVKKYGLLHRAAGHYFLIGNEPKPECTIIYISVIVSQIRSLLQIIIPELKLSNISFKIPFDYESTQMIMNGYLGYDRIGKAITIYIDDKKDQDIILEKLVLLTKEFKGPVIPNKLHIGGLVYRDCFDFKNENYYQEVNKNTHKVLKSKYVIHSILKNDIKGNVLKGWYFKSFLKIMNVVIKEGKKHMISNREGLDIKDRLKWQEKIHKELYTSIRMPRVLDFFEINGDSFLVLEFITGNSLNNEIGRIYQGRSWVHLSGFEKSSLLSILLEVSEIVEKLHSKGYVHRDLTPDNFLRSNDGNLYIIDMELTYSLKYCYPDPPFKLGSEGYISTEQREAQTPTLKEDIFALGALMIFIFTNLPPMKLDLKNPESVKKSLMFFTGDENISTVIVSCLNSDSELRPNLQKILSTITLMKTSVVESNFKYEKQMINISELREIIASAMTGLTFCEITRETRLFKIQSQVPFSLGLTEYTNKELGILSPLFGVFYILSKTKEILISDEVVTFYKKYVQKYKDVFYSKSNTSSSLGLFNGTAGKALLIHYGVQAGVLEEENDIGDQIIDCFNQSSEYVNLSYGLAGQALASLLIYKRSTNDLLKKKIHDFISLIIHLQLPNGNWKNKSLGRNNKEVTIGLASGTSGIVYSLILYHSIFPNEKIRVSINKALSYIISVTELSTQKNMLNYDNRSLIDGHAGIALIFMYAFKEFNQPAHKVFAENILSTFPEYPVSFDSSFGHGLAGLGYVYCEASIILPSPVWRERAIWIFNLLKNTIHGEKENCITWNVNGVPENDAGIFNGFSGIILFLSKLLHSNINRR